MSSVPPRLHCHDDGIAGIGPIPCDIMVCGIAPGEKEVEQGEPLVGPSGQLWRACLKTVGFDHDSTYRTNLICTWNNEPTDAELAACRPRLQQEIELVKPKLIIPLGTIASQQFTGYKIGQVRGQPIYYENVMGTSHSCRIMPTWHPAAFLRDGGQTYIVDIIRDLAKLMQPPTGQDLLNWPIDKGHFKWRVLGLDTIAVLQLLDPRYPVAIDIETGNADNIEEMTMDVHTERMLCFAIAQDTPELGTQSWVITPEFYPLFTEWFKEHSHEYRWLMHYGFFDKPGLKQFLGIDIELGLDTLARSVSLDERQGVHKLKTLAREYTGAGRWEQPIHDAIDTYRENSKVVAKYKAWAIDHPEEGPLVDFTNGELCSTSFEFYDFLAPFGAYKSRRGMSEAALTWYNAELERLKHPSWDVVPEHIMYKYNGEDAARTAQLEPILTRMLEDDGTLSVAEFLERDINVNAEIAYNGVHVDLAARDDLCIRWGEKWQKQHTELQEWAEREGYVNEDGTKLNLSSPRQKATFIYDMLGVPLPESKKSYTATGQRTTSVKLLDTVKESHEWLTDYIDFVHLDHSLNSYVLPLPSFVRAGDYLHAVWKPHAARTLRDAYADPPLHQIPGYDETGGGEIQAMFDCPSESSYGQRPRICFTIHDAIYCYIPDGHGGWLFVAADYERAEFYVMAHISGDQALLDDVSATDMHRATAANVLYRDTSAPYEDEDYWHADKGKWQRYFAKRFNFGKAYGMQPDTMAKEWLHCSVREAKELDYAWNQRYHVWVAYTKTIRNEAMRTGEIVSPITGCKRRFRLISGADSFHELNQAINFNIQNGACWVTKNARVKLHEIFKHMPLETAQDPQHVLGIIRTIMTTKHLPIIPGLPIELKVGTRWSNVKTYTLEAAA